MNFAIVIFIILSTCYGINCGRKRSAQCMIDIRTDLIRNPTGSVKEPLILKRSGSAYKLMIPEDGILKFKIGESAEVVCTSDQKPNFLTYSKFL